MVVPRRELFLWRSTASDKKASPTEVGYFSDPGGPGPCPFALSFLQRGGSNSSNSGNACLRCRISRPVTGTRGSGRCVNPHHCKPASGAKSDRAQLRRVLAHLGSGDVFLVTRLDRLARSTRSFEHRLQSPKSVPAFSPLARRAGRVRAR